MGGVNDTGGPGGGVGLLGVVGFGGSSALWGTSMCAAKGNGCGSGGGPERRPSYVGGFPSLRDPPRALWGGGPPPPPPPPDGSQDEKYWSRRSRNNAAARRSREMRRLKENQISARAAFLERENAALRHEVAAARRELQRFRALLARYEARHGAL